MAGELNIEAMLCRLTAKQFIGWEEYYTLEPFGEIRADWRAASIREMIHNVAVKAEHQKPIEHFLLHFKTKERETPESLEEQALAKRQQHLTVIRAIANAYSVKAIDT